MKEREETIKKYIGSTPGLAPKLDEESGTHPLCGTGDGAIKQRPPHHRRQKNQRLYLKDLRWVWGGALGENWLRFLSGEASI